MGHSCRSRECPTWVKEKAICALKVEHEIPYGEARRKYEEAHQPPTLQAYADVVRTPSASKQGDADLREKVERLEKKIDDMTTILAQLTQQLNISKDFPNQKVRQETSAEVVADVPECNDEMDESGSRVHTLDLDVAAMDTHTSRYQKPVTQAHGWKEVKGKGRGKGKGEGQRHDTVPEPLDEDLNPSQPLVRRCRSTDRPAGKPGPSSKKSWKDLS